MALVPNLYRPTQGRMIAGVCAGIARYLSVDVQVVRAVLVVLVAVGGLGAWVYPVLWLLMPEQGSETAGIDTLVAQAKQWKTDSEARRDASTPTEQPVFNPYVDEKGRPE